jgi:hypothetical protein
VLVGVGVVIETVTKWQACSDLGLFCCVGQLQMYVYRH